MKEKSIHVLCTHTCSIFIILIFLSIVLIINTANATSTFSLTCNQEALNVVLAKTSKVTGYRIEITKGWENKLVSFNTKQSTLDDCIKTIIRSLGSPNHAVIKDDHKKRVQIRIFDASAGYSTAYYSVEPKKLVAEEAHGRNIARAPDEAAKPQFINEEVGLHPPEPEEPPE